MVTSLAGRSALVTGAGSPDGIGFAGAQQLADLGMTVHVTSMTQRALSWTAGTASSRLADGADRA